MVFLPERFLQPAFGRPPFRGLIGGGGLAGLFAGCCPCQALPAPMRHRAAATAP